MLVLILIDVQYSQKAVFSFKKASNGQNHKITPPQVLFTKLISFFLQMSSH